ncbi:uncharacterized protein BX664DRAFT_321274 [Halteromyces radiatus]|uniref:uncharacterized protein n=1 Tax=Halteromyces radiatus TaxID=101107 RepID=UPI0022202BAA|nr:uncharacterized protein BX664DRAFT_321274 [Halteromyces radiatus]KAI8099449.1 hypothetical protein BX664DRAFT_321274 [Halteromyces radiatus]
MKRELHSVAAAVVLVWDETRMLLSLLLVLVAVVVEVLCTMLLVLFPTFLHFPFPDVSFLFLRVLFFPFLVPFSTESIKKKSKFSALCLHWLGYTYHPLMLCLVIRKTMFQFIQTLLSIF